jgi:hypothetical protein
LPGIPSVITFITQHNTKETKGGDKIKRRRPKKRHKEETQGRDPRKKLKEETKKGQNIC